MCQEKFGMGGGGERCGGVVAAGASGSHGRVLVGMFTGFYITLVRSLHRNFAVYCFYVAFHTSVCVALIVLCVVVAVQLCMLDGSAASEASTINCQSHSDWSSNGE